MKNLLPLFLLFLITSCASESSNILDDIEYSIIKEDRNDVMNKTNINVLINKKTTEEVLTEIAKELKSEREDLNMLWIFYYPEGQSTEGMAWATSHYSPELEVKILGSTDEEDEQTAKADDIPGEVLGKWRAKCLMGAAMIMYKDSTGALYMQTNFTSGKPMTEQLKESDSKGLKRFDFDNTHGEYYILEKGGLLGMYDTDGKFEDATIIE